MVASGAACFVWAAVARSPRPLLGVLGLLPLVALYFWLDARLVAAWRQGVLERWAREGLDLAAFRAALASLPQLPAGTLDGMLATLPRDGASALRALEPGARLAVTFALAEIDARARGHALVVALVRACVIAAAVAAAVLQSRGPLWLLAAVPLLLIAERAADVARLRRWRRALEDARRAVADWPRTTAAIAALDWRAIPDTLRDRFLRALS